MNELMDTISDLEEELDEIRKDRDEWSDMFDSVLKSYTDAGELLYSCKKEITMLLEICKQQGIQIAEDEHFVDFKELENF
jgi:hypothetical protein